MTPGPVRRDRLGGLLAREEARRREDHPRSEAAHRGARASLVGGVPMPWMMRWAGGFPVVAASADGNPVVDLDGHEYVDLCLGETGAMTGHAPVALVDAVRAEEAFARMIPLASRFADDLRAVLARHALPWNVTQLAVALMGPTTTVADVEHHTAVFAEAVDEWLDAAAARLRGSRP